MAVFSGKMSSVSYHQRYLRCAVSEKCCQAYRSVDSDCLCDLLYE